MSPHNKHQPEFIFSFHLYHATKVQAGRRQMERQGFDMGSLNSQAAAIATSNLPLQALYAPRWEYTRATISLKCHEQNGKLVKISYT